MAAYAVLDWTPPEGITRAVTLMPDADAIVVRLDTCCQVHVVKVRVADMPGPARFRRDLGELANSLLKTTAARHLAGAMAAAAATPASPPDFPRKPSPTVYH